MKSKILPPTYFFILLFLSIALHFFFPVKKIVHPPITYSGFLLIAFGAIINLWADYLIKKKKTTVKPYKKPTALITSGPFRITRNPQYLGFTAILLGVAINHGSISAFIGPVVFAILMHQLFIPFEEKNLEKIFGKKYVDYKRKVRRWI